MQSYNLGDFTARFDPAAVTNGPPAGVLGQPTVLSGSSFIPNAARR